MPKRKLPGRGEPGTVYLIHLSVPVGHASHYIGFALDHEARFREHLAGRGGRLLAVANSRGVRYVVVRIWSPADRRFERRVKNRSCAPKLCPVCNPLTWKNWLPVVNDAKPIKRPVRKTINGQIPVP